MGLIATAFTNAVNGCQSVLCDGFRFPDVIDMIGRNGVTILPTSPGVLNALVMLKTAPPLDSVRLLYCTTAPLGHEIRQRAAARFGRHIYELYGMTETSTLVTFGPLEPKPPVGSVGRPVPGAEVRIRDAERRDLPVGTHGEVWVRSPGLMKGYYKNDGQTRKAVVSGWYRSGDVGFVDADGHLFIVDRIKDVIFVGGQNVYPSEIEAALQAYEGVATAVVVKMAHPATIEAPLAYVVPVLGARLDAGELLAYLRGRLTPYKMPRRVEIVDSLPIGTSGKIVRRRLTEPPE
jgi:long-chain acyl-CoA synthetase